MRNSRAGVLSTRPESAVDRRRTAPDTGLVSATRTDESERSASREAARRRLGFSADTQVVLALPPYGDRSGSVIAAWAFLLVHQVLPNARFLLGGDAGTLPQPLEEFDRVVRLFADTRLQASLVLAPRDLTLEALLDAADLGVHLSAAGGPTWGCEAAAARGLPLLLTRSTSTVAAVTTPPRAWSCEPNQPHDAAKWMLRALDKRGQKRG